MTTLRKMMFWLALRLLDWSTNEADDTFTRNAHYIQTITPALKSSRMTGSPSVIQDVVASTSQKRSQNSVRERWIGANSVKIVGLNDEQRRFFQ